MFEYSYCNCSKQFDTFEPININQRLCVHTIDIVIVIVQSNSTLSNHLILLTSNVYIDLI